MTVINHQIPRGPNGEKDFNDWHRAGKLDEMKRLMKEQEEAEPAKEEPAPLLDHGELRADIDEWLPPPRPWLIAGRFLRRAVSFTVAPPDTGKTAFQMAYAVSLASGRSIMGREVRKPVNVWFYTNEEEKEETLRRYLACCRLHQIKPSSLIGRLRLSSGYGSERLIITTQTESGILVPTPQKKELIEQIRENNIGALLVDPFGSTHEANENSNSEIEGVMTDYRDVAKTGNCAIDIAAHCPKQGSDSEAHAGKLDAVRGASASVAAGRISYTLSSMNKDSAKTFGIDDKERGYLVREDKAKGNYTPKAENARWYELVSVCMDNDPEEPDWVAAVRPRELTAVEGQRDSKNHERDSSLRVALLKLGMRIGEKRQLLDCLDELASTTGLGRSTVRDAVVHAIPHEKDGLATAEANHYWNKEAPPSGGKQRVVIHRQ